MKLESKYKEIGDRSLCWNPHVATGKKPKNKYFVAFNCVRYSACDHPSDLSMMLLSESRNRTAVSTGKFPRFYLGLCRSGRIFYCLKFRNLVWNFKTMRNICQFPICNERVSQLHSRVNVFSFESLNVSSLAALFGVPHYNILPHSFSQLSQSSSVVRKRRGNE